MLTQDIVEPLDEQNLRVNEIEKMDLQNEEINNLIDKAREEINRRFTESERLAEEARLRELEEKKKNEEKPQTSLSDYLSIIAAAPDADVANEKINEALNLFASPDVPVLIIVYRMGNIIDYDAPTTAERYLNYIKDQKKVTVRVNDVKFDENYKITELELIKN